MTIRPFLVQEPNLRNVFYKRDIIIDRYQIIYPSLWKGVHMVTVTKQDLIALNYGPSFSADIIRECKKLMISKGYTYYQSKKLDRVPKKAVEEVLGITLDV